MTSSDWWGGSVTFDPDLEPCPGAAGLEVRGQAADLCVCVSTQLELHAGQDVVVYDQNSLGPNHVSPDSFLSVVLLKLRRSFTTVHLLSGESPGPVPGSCPRVLTLRGLPQAASWSSPSSFRVCARASPSWSRPAGLSPASPSAAPDPPGSCLTCTWAASGTS